MLLQIPKTSLDVLRIWEHQIIDNRARTLSRLSEFISENT